LIVVGATKFSLSRD